jgi:hypothetical protein
MYVSVSVESEDITGGLPPGDRLWRIGNIHLGKRTLFRKSCFVKGAYDEGN